MSQGKSARPPSTVTTVTSALSSFVTSALAEPESAKNEKMFG
jgi:hypothetical protein